MNIYIELAKLGYVAYWYPEIGGDIKGIKFRKKDNSNTIIYFERPMNRTIVYLEGGTKLVEKTIVETVKKSHR